MPNKHFTARIHVSIDDAPYEANEGYYEEELSRVIQNQLDMGMLSCIGLVDEVRLEVTKS